MKKSTKKNITRKAICLGWVSAVSSLYLSVYASAASSQASSIGGKILQFASDVKYIAYAIAALAVIVLAIILIAGGQGALQKAKGVAVPIIIGVLVLSFGTGILGTFAGKGKVKNVAAVDHSPIFNVENENEVIMSDGSTVSFDC